MKALAALEAWLRLGHWDLRQVEHCDANFVPCDPINATSATLNVALALALSVDVALAHSEISVTESFGASSGLWGTGAKAHSHCSPLRYLVSQFAIEMEIEVHVGPPTASCWFEEVPNMLLYAV